MSEKIKTGVKAPDFSATTSEGKKVQLSDFRGRPVWLIFYRYATCPLCNFHICNFFYRFESTRSNMVVLGIFESSKEEFPEAHSPITPEFVMICDPEKKLYDLYGTESNLLGLLHPKVTVDLVRARIAGFKQGKIAGELGQIPAHFLIGADGNIVRAYYGKHIDDHIDWEDVSHFIESESPPKVAEK